MGRLWIETSALPSGQVHFPLMGAFQTIKEFLMKIVIIGSGYVGLVTAACFSEVGLDVWCADVDEARVERLRRGECPIFEPALPELLSRNLQAGRLHFVTSAAECVEGAEAVFIAVGTPEGEDGRADVSHVLEAARSVGRVLNGYAVIIVKSTVPVGTTAMAGRAIAEELRARGVEVPFDMASNPEFLKEGHAVDDFMTPDRVIIGVESARARDMMSELYRPFMMTNDRMLFMDSTSAELTKYAANAMLATRISFMNDIANLCERVGARVDLVRKGIGMDRRIGPKFLYAGCGYGGSCFPKDVKALIATAGQHGYEMEVLRAVERVNERQKRLLFDKLAGCLGEDLKGATIAVWGLAFKPGTDDLREAPSLVLVRQLLEAGCRVRVFDPVAMENARKVLGNDVFFAADMYDAALGADALAVVTEWKEFRLPGWKRLRGAMRRTVIVDGRNIYDRERVRSEGFDYCRVG